LRVELPGGLGADSSAYTHPRVADMFTASACSNFQLDVAHFVYIRPRIEDERLKPTRRERIPSYTCFEGFQQGGFPFLFLVYPPSFVDPSGATTERGTRLPNLTVAKSGCAHFSVN